MQLPLENSSNPTVEAAEPSWPSMEAPIFDTFFGRTREPPTFLRMLDNLSDSPARRPRNASTASGDSLSVPGNQPTRTATSDRADAPQAPILVDATMDGRDPTVIRHHLTRFYPSGPNTSSVQPPIPSELIEPMGPSGMVPEFQVTPVGPVVGIFVHWYARDALPREPHPLVFTRWRAARRYYRQMYAAGQVAIGTAPRVAPPIARPVARPVTPLAITSTFSTTNSNNITSNPPPRTPTGGSNDPIVITTGSPKKRVFKATAKTQIKKGKKRAKIQQSSSPVRQPAKLTAPGTSTSRWPDLVILTDSEDDAAVAIAPALVPIIAPPVPPVAMAIDHSSDPEHEAARTPRPTTRCRPGRTRTARGRARRNASPRFTSPPDDMFLPDSPPRNQLATTATTAPVSTRPPALVDPFDDMFDSDSSDELLLSLFSAARRGPVAPVVPFTANPIVDLGNGSTSSQNTFGTPSSTHATRGLSSPVNLLSQPSNQVSNTPSTSRLFSPARDHSHTPLYFPSSPSASRTPQPFSPSGLDYPTGLVQHRHLNDHEFDFFLEQALRH